MIVLTPAMLEHCQALSGPSPDKKEGWHQKEHPAIQNFAISNHIDTNIGPMSQIPFGY